MRIPIIVAIKLTLTVSVSNLTTYSVILRYSFMLWDINLGSDQLTKIYVS
ncbi:MAG TPA: hypothetical protein HA262_07760 [Methanosarcina sp.]|nr:hypothetical protein [Methanosarcina sp.]